jgi:hypothetical protein
LGTSTVGAITFENSISAEETGKAEAPPKKQPSFLYRQTSVTSKLVTLKNVRK